MKKFSVPTMTIQKLEDEDVMRTSGGCFEINACVDCYCGIVTCEGTYGCDGLQCPTLSDFD